MQSGCGCAQIPGEMLQGSKQNVDQYHQWFSLAVASLWMKKIAIQLEGQNLRIVLIATVYDIVQPVQTHGIILYVDALECYYYNMVTVYGQRKRLKDVHAMLATRHNIVDNYFLWATKYQLCTILCT